MGSIWAGMRRHETLGGWGDGCDGLSGICIEVVVVVGVVWGSVVVDVIESMMDYVFYRYLIARRL